MELLQAMRERHSVRAYTDKPIEGKVKEDLLSFVEKCNKQSGLHMQVILNEPEAFNSLMAHYGKFSGVNNYIALIGDNGPDLDEKCGYWGEKIALYVQTLGMNTCWVAMTYSKRKAHFTIEAGEKLCLVIAVGYGLTQGIAHKSKPRARVMKTGKITPQWFVKGVDAALLAPTAMNQQKFRFSLEENTVTAKAGIGFYSKVDLGIAKYHFELGAGRENFKWK